MLAVCIADLPGAFCARMLGAEQHCGGIPPAYNAGLEQESHGKSGIALFWESAIGAIFAKTKNIEKIPCIFFCDMLL
jgi:hypothetical protein